MSQSTNGYEAVFEDYCEAVRLLPEHARRPTLAERVQAALDERDRLQAIVDRLPKTADGVPVVPGMQIWPFFEIEDEQGAVVCLCAHDGPTGEMLVDGDTMNVGKCYSTRDAAVAAREGAGT